MAAPLLALGKDLGDMENTGEMFPPLIPAIISTLNEAFTCLSICILSAVREKLCHQTGLSREERAFRH